LAPAGTGGRGPLSADSLDRFGRRLCWFGEGILGYEFEWDSETARSNARKHGVTFDEASTVFGDPLSLLMPDPDYSLAEQR